MFYTSTNKLVLEYLLLINSVTYQLIQLTNKKIFIPINRQNQTNVDIKILNQSPIDFWQ